MISCAILRICRSSSIAVDWFNALEGLARLSETTSCLISKYRESGIICLAVSMLSYLVFSGLVLIPVPFFISCLIKLAYF